MKAETKKGFLLIGWIVMFEAVAALIGYTTHGDVMAWYSTLKAPSFRPPNEIFPIVWTALYVLIAMAGWRIYLLPDTEKRRQLFKLYVLYVALNWSWSFVFFSLHLLSASFAWISAINLVTLLLIGASWKLDKRVAILMILPLLWTCFAAYLDYSYLQLNQ